MNGADSAGGTTGRRAAALEALALAALGALHSVPFVQTGAWWVQIGCVAVLAWRVSAASPGRAALIGWVFGTAWLASGVWWLFISMHRYGGLPAPLAALAVAALAGALSLYLALAMAVWARWRRGRLPLDALTFAALWLVAELSRGVLFTGFPWVAAGYAHVDGPLAALAPWVGVYGIGAVAAGLAALLGAGWAGRAGVRRGGSGAVAAVLALAAAAAAGPGEFSRPAGGLTVSLVQTNVAQDQKFAMDHLPGALAWLADAVLAAPDGLVVAPETAVPLLPGQLDQVDPAYWPRLQAHFATPGRALLLGVPLGDYHTGYTNSVRGLAAGTDYRYDKHHLVPFGEFVPLGFRWFTEAMNIPLGDFARGPTDPPSFAFAGQRIAPNICYEDLFGEELGRRFADPATAPTIFANVSNIGWFGDTIAVDQHRNISRMRALEFQRPMLRATNTGATVVIDHRGRVTDALEPFTRGVLAGRVEGREGLTPYARWVARYGLWPLWLAAAAIVGAAAVVRPRAT